MIIAARYLESGVISKDLFGGYVKECLANLYDPGLLQTHPLVELLVPQHAPRETSAQHLREIILAALETLRPAEHVHYGRPEWLGYRIMWMRYAECRYQTEICQELRLARTTFYNAHRQALEAIASVLWARYQEQIPNPDSGNVGATSPAPAELAREEAMRCAHDSRREMVSLGTVLESVRDTITPLAKHRGVTLVIEAPQSLPSTYGDPAILRQIILNMLTDIIAVADGETIHVAVNVVKEDTVWQLRGWSASPKPEEDLERLPGFVVSRSLLGVYGGRFWVEGDGRCKPAIFFTLPVARPKAILIIDDSADALALYQRYLQAEEYRLRVARSGDEVRTILAETTPDLVLLDVLMPQQDGWDILQRLKTMPETTHIPVVICSVLSQPHLALVLGATRVLQKPIEQQALIQTVRDVLAQADSVG